MDFNFQAYIYHKGQENPFCIARKITLSETFMGECKVIATIESPKPIDFVVGDYLVYRERRYVLAITPSLQKQARLSSVSNAFKYDNISFISVASDELVRCEFRDVVNSNEHYNFAARSFNYHCISLADYGERLKANLDRMYKGSEAYTVKVLLTDGTTKVVSANSSTTDCVGKKNIVITSNDETCWDSLAHVKDDFGVNFYFESDRSIVLGANGRLLTQQYFEYGKGKGLFKINRTTDDSQKVVTRLRAYGSEKNMPTRFYSNLSYLYLFPKEYISRCTADVDGKQIDVLHDDLPETFTAPDTLDVFFSSQMLTNSQLSEDTAVYIEVMGEPAKLCNVVKVRIDDVSIWANIMYLGKEQDSWMNIGWNKTGDPKVVIFGDNTEAQVRAFNEKFMHYNDWSQLVIEVGYTQTWKYKTIDTLVAVPNNMAVKNLMLAGFGSANTNLRSEVRKVYENPNTPENAQLIARLGYPTFAELMKHYEFSTDPFDPYIDAVPQKAALGVSEGTITFDGSKDEYEEICPDIKYLGDGKDIFPEQSAKIDGATEATGNNLRNDGGVCDDLINAEKEIPQFYLYIKNPSFDPYEYRKDGATSFKVNIIDGMCGGRSFDCKQTLPCTFADGSRGYRLTCDRAADNSVDLYYPYSQISVGQEIGFVVKEGDRFTFSEIYMPKEYVLRAALYELFPAAVEALSKSCNVHYKYELSIDPVEMARQHEKSVVDPNVVSIYKTIHAGDLILFGDKDLDVNYDESNEEHPIYGGIIIDTLEIKDGEGKLPQYTVQLVDEKSVGTLQRMQKQIDAIVNGTTAVGNANYQYGDIQGIIQRYCTPRYLSKVTSDTMNGSLTVKGNIISDKSSSGTESHVGSAEFMEGLLGKGWRAYFGGHIEADSLSLRRFLEVPEIRFNRTTVTVGITWHTVGAGIIEEVTYEKYKYFDKETNSTRTAQGMVKLKLEDGEVGAIAYNDLAMGIWHNIGNSESTANETENYDGHNGNFTFAGFQTIYFRVAALCHKDGTPVEYDEAGNIVKHYDANGNDITCTNCQYFLYELREKQLGDHGWQRAYEPVSGMHFACYANRTNPERQSCWYQTTTYFIMLAGMTDWTYDSDRIQVLLGQRDGFTIRINDKETGEPRYHQLHGMGAAFGNVTRWGTEEVLDRDPVMISQRILWFRTDIKPDEMKAMPFDEIVKLQWHQMSDNIPKTTDLEPYLYQRWFIVYDTGLSSDSYAELNPDYLPKHPELQPWLVEDYSGQPKNYELWCDYAAVTREGWGEFITSDQGNFITADNGAFNVYGTLEVTCHRLNNEVETTEGYLCYYFDDATDTEYEYVSPVELEDVATKVTFCWYTSADKETRVLIRSRSVLVIEETWSMVISGDNCANLPKNESTKLVATVYAGGKDLTAIFKDDCFTWSRISGQSEEAMADDAKWAETRKADLHKRYLVVGDDDLYKQAQFVCVLDDGKELNRKNIQV